MKVAFVIESLRNSGGTERVTTVIAGELVKRGIEVDVISLHSGEPFFELDPRIGLVMLSHKKSSNFHIRWLLNAWRSRRMLKKRRYDYVIDVCAFMSAISIPASFEMRTKTITWEHFNINVGSHLYRHLASRFAHRVVVLTDADKAAWQTRFKTQRISRIFNPVTIEPGEPSPLTEKCFLALGRFCPQKGFDMLLDAWAVANCRNEGWKLRIVGSGPEEPQRREQIEKLGIGDSVEMLPPTKDVQKMYREASVYVLSSRFEGLPLVLIEAMSLGLPIVSFDCKTGPNEIVVNGETGVLLPPEDVAALAAAMDEIAADEKKRRRMGAAALERSRIFSPDTIVAQWMELLK